MTIWPTRTIPPTSPADRSAELEDAHERARFLDAIDARNAAQRERERRERRNEEPQRPQPQPPPPPPPPPVNRSAPQRPQPRREAPRLMARPSESANRDVMDVSRTAQRRPASGATITGAAGVAGSSSSLFGRPQSARLSDAVPGEARARIDEYLKTGRLDTRPFSFSPIDALAEPQPRGASLEPLATEPPPLAAPKPSAEPQPARTGLDNRLPFEFAAPMDLPGNRFDLLPVSLSAVQFGSSNR